LNLKRNLKTDLQKPSVYEVLCGRLRLLVAKSLQFLDNFPCYMILEHFQKAQVPVGPVANASRLKTFKQLTALFYASFGHFKAHKYCKSHSICFRAPTQDEELNILICKEAFFSIASSGKLAIIALKQQIFQL